MDPNFYDEVFLGIFAGFLFEFDHVKQCVYFLLQEGTSLMWLACESGQTNTVNVLLDSGADANLQSVSIFTLRSQ